MEQTQIDTNPLASYYRQPKIYLSLPSKGRFYPDGALDVSKNNSYAVYSMTAKDELMYKTPDALASGQSTVEVIKSCIPAILDPWSMPSIDVDACLVAIRIATYGEFLDISTTCSSCDTESDYTVTMVNYLNQISAFEYVSEIPVNDLLISIRPYTYRETTKTAIRAIEQEKIFKVISSDTLTEEEKLEQFGQSFSKLSQLTVDIVSGCITSIQTPTELVTDQKFINDFIQNCPKETFEAISKHISDLKMSFEFPPQKIECQNCQHQFDLTVAMDQSNFFAVRS